MVQLGGVPLSALILLLVVTDAGKEKVSSWNFWRFCKFVCCLFIRVYVFEFVGEFK